MNTTDDTKAAPRGSELSERLGPGAEACPTCGSDCNERDELDKAEREIDRLRAELQDMHNDRNEWMKRWHALDEKVSHVRQA
jgi:hypothetical protein